MGNVSSIEPNASFGVQVAAKTVRVANTVVYGNGETPVQEIGPANLDCFSHCVSSVSNDQCATWHVIDARAFRHDDRRDEGIRRLRPKSYIDGVLGPLIGTGTTWDDYTGVYGGTSSRDLLGGPRLVGGVSTSAAWRGIPPALR